MYRSSDCVIFGLTFKRCFRFIGG